MAETSANLGLTLPSMSDVLGDTIPALARNFDIIDGLVATKAIPTAAGNLAALAADGNLLDTGMPTPTGPILTADVPLLVPVSTTPSNPPAGKYKVWFGADGKLHQLDPLGNDSYVGGTPGAGLGDVVGPGATTPAGYFAHWTSDHVLGALIPVPAGILAGTSTFATTGDAQNFTNKAFDDCVKIRQAVTPGDPGAGYASFYPDASGFLRFKTHDLVDEAVVPRDGWFNCRETWTCAVIDDPSYTFTISGDKTTKYIAGMRVKLTQTTVKYGIITAVSYSSGTGLTSITVYGGNDYDWTTDPITAAYFSSHKTPTRTINDPVDLWSPARWTVESSLASDDAATDLSHINVTNMGGKSISVPIGAWVLSARACVKGTKASPIAFTVGLSTANNSFSDSGLISSFYTAGATNMTIMVSIGPKAILLSSKTSYYLNARPDLITMTALTTLGSTSPAIPTILRAVCAYL